MRLWNGGILFLSFFWVLGNAWPYSKGNASNKDNSLYEALNVSREAKAIDIKKAFRRLSKIYHPDVNPSEDAVEKFKAITHAYEILSDGKKRSRYDKEGLSGLENPDIEDRGGFASMFGDAFFGGFGRANRREKADDVSIKLYMSLEQLYQGETLHIVYKRPVVCMYADECIKPRSDCIGPGTRITQQQIAPGYLVQTQDRDPRCVDKKKSWTSGRCRKCPEGPLQLEETVLMAFVERGMQSGDQIKFEGAGEQSLSLDPGDLFLVIEEEQEKDKYLRDINNNLHTQLFITLTEGLLGFNATIPHVSGVPTSIQRDGVSLDGDVIRIPGKGMPKRGKPDQFGDLYVKLRLRYPSNNEISQSKREQIKAVLSDITTWQHLSSPNTYHS